MSKESAEIISLLVDDEVTDGAIEHLLTDKSASDKWARYHLASDILNNEVSENLDLELCQRIQQSIQAEPAILAPKRSFAFQPWVKQASGFAIAASVTFAVILGMENLVPTNTLPIQGSNLIAAPMPQSDQHQVQTQVALSAEEQAELDRLDDLFMRHASQSASHGVNGMFPYVRAVSMNTYQLKAKQEQNNKQESEEQDLNK